jgi:hypothetical protein
MANELIQSNAFKDLSTDYVVLLHRFVSQRDEFLRTHNLLDGKAIAKLTGLQDSNVSRKMQLLRDGGNILFVRLGDVFLYPEFQLDKQACVYSALVDALPKLYDAGRSGWDNCFWLFTKQSILESRAAQPTNLKNLKFDDMIKRGNRANLQSTYHDTMPIEALRDGNDDIFSALKEEWIDPDNRKIATRKQAIGKH